ncbi:MAG: DapH/DapD/GlmU-related protein [Phycisphaerae bacterium]
MNKFLRALFQAINRWYAVRDNVKLGKRVHLGPGTVLWAPRELVVEDDVYIGKGCTIEVNGCIGRYTMIANRVGLVGRRDHDMHSLGKPMRYAPWIGDADSPYRTEPGIIVGPDCWIGYGAIIVSGVTLGRGVVVAAGAVVTKDVPAYSIVAGVPAKVVGMRFTPEESVIHEQAIRELEKLAGH